MRRAEQAADTRTALIDAAKRLFASRGYLNTKITDITAEAGRAAGSFYNHFAGKEELLEALLAEMLDAGDRSALAEEHKDDFTDPAAVRFHVALFWRVQRDNAATMQALAQAAMVSPEFARKIEQLWRAQFTDLADHLKNVADLPASPEITLTLLSAMFEGLSGTWSRLPDDQAVEVVTRFLYRAVNGRDY